MSNLFRPRGFFMRQRRALTKASPYPAFPQQLALSDVLCRLPLSKNRDTAKRRSRVDSVPKNALCLSKTQRHSPRVKTLVGFTVNSWNSNSTSGVMRPWGYGPPIFNECVELPSSNLKLGLIVALTDVRRSMHSSEEAKSQRRTAYP